MIEKTIDWCARNRFLVLVGALFASSWGIWCAKNIPLDAIPDLSDVQVIVFTEWPGRSPDLVEDQITYPLVSSMLSAPRVKFVRGQSFFGLSFVYVIFEDGTDMYWARSRVMEYMQGMSGKLPEGLTPVIGPDATGVGWVFQYALVDETGESDLQELRSFQDWTLKFALESIPGVAQVASVGGYVKQYQVEINPNALLAYGIPLNKVISAIRDSNNDVGGRVVEMTGREYMVRGRGYIRSVEDIETIPVGPSHNGVPVLIGDLGRVQIGPEMRRGAAELDGKGEVVGGIVIMRYGENALKVIERVKEKLEELKGSLPPGAKIVTAYDRSTLILGAIHTLKTKLAEEMLVVALVICLFLWHFRSALVPIFTLPIAALLSFIPMYYMGLSSNIMSLGGIAIAVGAMVDASVVIIENAHKRLEQWEAGGRQGDRTEVLIESAKEVGRPIFFSLLVIAVSFTPIFTLEAQEGRLFKPLAFTKNFSMAFAAFVSITLAPAMMVWLLRGKEYDFRPGWLCSVANFLWGGKIHAEKDHPISRRLFKIYMPVVDAVLKRPKAVIGAAALIVLLTVPVYFRLGSEFMPPLWEGSFLYMPTAVPGMSITEAKRALHLQDKILKSFPEVERVFGKVGRARTPTDPAPLSMVETTVTLKPMDQWRPGMTVEKLKAEMDKVLQFPGMPNIWWMPIQTRIEMLATGIRSAVGVKVMGPDLAQIEKIATQVEVVLKSIEGTTTAFAERATGGYFIDFEVDRRSAARHGLTVGDVERIIQTAIGGMNVTTTVEGRERYSVNVRYPRGLRDNPEKLKRVLVPTPGGAQVPIGQLAKIGVTTGPSSIRDENGSLASFVFADVAGRDLGGWVEESKETVRARVALPPGYRLEWAGQYRYLVRAKERLKLVVPLTLFAIFMLIYFNTRSFTKTGIVLLAVPFSLVGAVWLLYFLGYNMSVAVWVGILALAGVDAETGIIMMLYLDMAHAEATKAGHMDSQDDLKDAIRSGAVLRIRPKIMTVGTTFLALMPIMWAGLGEPGADVMKRIAAPMVGGIFTSFGMELLVYPAIYFLWKSKGLRPGSARST